MPRVRVPDNFAAIVAGTGAGTAPVTGATPAPAAAAPAPPTSLTLDIAPFTPAICQVIGQAMYDATQDSGDRQSLKLDPEDYFNTKATQAGTAITAGELAAIQAINKVNRYVVNEDAADGTHTLVHISLPASVHTPSELYAMPTDQRTRYIQQLGYITMCGCR